MQQEAAVIESRHADGLMRTLVDQTHQPLDEVRRVYETQFRTLEKHARVRKYLPILAARRAREILMTG